VRELHDIFECLSDADGSARVVTFEHCSWNGVEELISGLGTTFERYTATYGEGEETTNPAPTSVVSSVKQKGLGHLVFYTGVGLMKHLQIWVWMSENAERPLVEALFFPDEIDTRDLRGTFLEWASGMCTRLEAVRYYARYENWSWTVGDIGPGSLVFLVSSEPEKDA